MSVASASSTVPTAIAEGIHSFFASTPAPPSIELFETTLRQFIAAIPADQPIVFITSGGTLVPLERNMVRFVDNFSTGTRGASMAEGFIDAGYAVIFLHRSGSAIPFLRRFATTLGKQAAASSSATSTAAPSLNSFATLDSLQVGKDGVSLQLVPSPASTAVLSSIQQFQKHRSSILPLEFQSVAEYMHALRLISVSLRPLGERVACFFAAAVSDYHIPFSQMSTHKLDSRAGGSLHLEMEQTPKVLWCLRHDVPTTIAAASYSSSTAWLPRAFLCSFKLETDSSLLIKKSASALRSYGVNIVLANELHTRYEQVRIIRLKGDTVTGTDGDSEAVVELVARPPSTSTSTDPFAGELEVKLVDRLVEMHREWRKQE